MAARTSPSRGAKPDKLWRDALMRAVHRLNRDGTTKRLEALADKCVEMALAGNIEAMKEIGNRLDGRAPQAVSGVAEEPHKLIVEIIDPTKRD